LQNPRIANSAVTDSFRHLWRLFKLGRAGKL
jgi:hypothetical protein